MSVDIELGPLVSNIDASDSRRSLRNESDGGRSETRQTDEEITELRRLRGQSREETAAGSEQSQRRRRREIEKTNLF